MKRLAKCRMCAGKFWQEEPSEHVCPECLDDAEDVVARDQPDPAKGSGEKNKP